MNLQALVQKVLAAWMLQDLRRFVMLEFSSIRPYLISAMSNWARADRLKYAYLDSDGKVNSLSTTHYSAPKSHSWSHSCLADVRNSLPTGAKLRYLKPRFPTQVNMIYEKWAHLTLNTMPTVFSSIHCFVISRLSVDIGTHCISSFPCFTDIPSCVGCIWP